MKHYVHNILSVVYRYFHEKREKCCVPCVI